MATPVEIHPGTGEPSNRYRAERGHRIALKYRQEYDKGEPIETVLIDAISDLFHYASEQGIDPARVAARAAEHYMEELALEAEADRERGDHATR